MCMSKPKDNSAEIARKQEKERQQRIKEGTARVDEIFSQFTPDFYDGVKTDYLGYYEPQVEDQFADARKRTVANLYKTGNIQGSAGAGKLADLFKAYNTQRQSIADQALARAEQMKSDVASNRADLISQLEAGAGVDTTAETASARAASLTQPMPYSPLSDLFAQFTGNFAQSQALKAHGYPGISMPGFGGGNSSSVSVVR